VGWEGGERERAYILMWVQNLGGELVIFTFYNSYSNFVLHIDKFVPKSNPSSDLGL